MAEKTENTITVFRRQVIQTGNYEPAEASCSVTIAINSDDKEAVAKEIADWGETLEIANYEALGVGYELSEQGVRMIQKEFPSTTKSAPVASAPASNNSYGTKGTGGTLDDIWKDLMENKSNWWDPNWQKKLDPDSNFNKAGPDYKRKADGKGIWLTKKDGNSLVPDWFVCPFTGKDANELGAIGTEIRS